MAEVKKQVITNCEVCRGLLRLKQISEFSACVAVEYECADCKRETKVILQHRADCSKAGH
jgi:bacterioferritin-associated ferredoxin